MMPADLRLQCFLEPVRTAVTDRAIHCPKCNPDSVSSHPVFNVRMLLSLKHRNI